MVVGVGIGNSAPFSKFPTAITPVFPRLTSGDQPSMSDQRSSDKQKEPESMDVDDDDKDSLGSDFDSEDGLPDFASGQSHHSLPNQHVDVGPSSENCIICSRPKVMKDFLLCDNPVCFQKLSESTTGSSSQSVGPSRSLTSLCPVCNDAKPMDQQVCGKQLCHERLRFWQGFPPKPTMSHNPRHSLYSEAVQTRGQTRSGGNLCQVCRQRPRYSKNGKTYPTCGLTCASMLPPARVVEMCDFCHQKPKVFLNGKVYPHCGKTCRDKAKEAEANKDLATCSTCLNCWKAPANLDKDEFCSDSCRTTIAHAMPLLLEIPRGHRSFNEVESAFKGAWTKRTVPCPTIKKIYMLCISPQWDANFEEYGKKVSYRLPGSFLNKKKDELRWISGMRDCCLGHPGMLNLCELPQCQLCQVLRGTYISESFGRGVVTTSLPRATQSYDRWAEAAKFTKLSKVVLLARVHMGKTAELDSHQIRSLTRPPQGSNSVKIVNYSHQGLTKIDMDEVVVYSCEALRPVYLINYD